MRGAEGRACVALVVVWGRGGAQRQAGRQVCKGGVGTGAEGRQAGGGRERRVGSRCRQCCCCVGQGGGWPSAHGCTQARACVRANTHPPTQRTHTHTRTHPRTHARTHHTYHIHTHTIYTRTHTTCTHTHTSARITHTLMHKRARIARCYPPHLHLWLAATDGVLQDVLWANRPGFSRPGCSRQGFRVQGRFQTTRVQQPQGIGLQVRGAGGRGSGQDAADQITTGGTGRWTPGAGAGRA